MSESRCRELLNDWRIFVAEPLAKDAGFDGHDAFPLNEASSYPTFWGHILNLLTHSSDWHLHICSTGIVNAGMGLPKAPAYVSGSERPIHGIKLCVPPFPTIPQVFLVPSTTAVAQEQVLNAENLVILPHTFLSAVFINLLCYRLKNIYRRRMTIPCTMALSEVLGPIPSLHF
jgi:hypothetical protein